MELFLPGVIVILLAAFFAFMVLPRIGTTILVVVSVFSLLLAGYHHYYLFSSEYTLSTWQNKIAAYAPFVILLFAFLFIAGGLEYVYSGANSAASAAAAAITPAVQLGNSALASLNMPPASTATNPITAAINTGVNALKNSPLVPNY
jgi:hypothetical protein